MSTLPPDSVWTKGLWRGKLLHVALRPALSVFFRVRNRFHYKAYKPESKTFLLLTNHNSTCDHFLNALGVRSYIRFVVSDHLMRKGFGSAVLKFLVNPIPRRKGTSGQPTVEMIKQNLRLGIPVIMYAEGNRSFNGRTGFISPRTGQLVKDAEGSLITYRIDGAYMQTPRWGHTLRKGPLYGQVVHEYPREELDKMSVEEINAHIHEDLYSDAYAYQREHKFRYPGKGLAEHLETTLFVCPVCGKIDTLKSSGDRFFCKCGFETKVNEYGFFEGGRFETVYDWDMWQRGELKRMADTAKSGSSVITRDTDTILYEVNGDNKKVLGSGLELTLESDRMVFSNAINKFEFKLADMKATAVAHTAFLYFSCLDKYYEVHCAHIWPANKYFAFHRIINGMEYV